MSHKKTLKETPEQLIQRILRQNKDMEEKVAKEAAQGSLKNDSNDVPVDKAPAKGVESGSEMLKSEAQKYVVRKVDEKLGEEMGYETKTAEEEGKDDPFL